MATKQRTVDYRACDWSGDELDDEMDHETRSLEWADRTVQFDFTVDSAHEFDNRVDRYDVALKELSEASAAVQEFVDKVTPVAAPKRARRSKPTGTAAPKPSAARRSDPARLKAIRDWAALNGHPGIGEKRGRIPKDIIAEFDAAHAE